MKYFLISLITLLILQNSNGETAPKKNILLLCIDDLRPELNCFGATYIHSPHIDQLAAQGRPFHRHYVNSPSCGPSRYSLLTGQLGTPTNQALFHRANEIAKNPTSAASVTPSLPAWFRKNGYITVSVGKVSHHPGGLGGSDWNDPQQLEMPHAWDHSHMPCGDWKHPRGAMHGLSHGQVRLAKNKQGSQAKAAKLDALEASPGADTIYPDGLITQEALNQITHLSKDPTQPFFLAIGLIKPHLPFGAPEKYLRLYDNVTLPPIPHPHKPSGKTTWMPSSEFKNQYNHHGKDPSTDPAYATSLRKHYAACVSYVDSSVGQILTQLKATGADKNTIIVLWGDHGWNLGEHGMWGKHNLFEEALRSPLIITYPGLPAPGQASQATVDTLDLFPTLCALTQLPSPPFAQGQSLHPQLQQPSADGHPAIAIWKNAHTIRTDQHRLILHKDGHVELYDHTTTEKETLNIAPDHPEIVTQLSNQLKARLLKKN